MSVSVEGTLALGNTNECLVLLPLQRKRTHGKPTHSPTKVEPGETREFIGLPYRTWVSEWLLTGKWETSKLVHYLRAEAQPGSVSGVPCLPSMVSYNRALPRSTRPQESRAEL